MALTKVSLINDGVIVVGHLHTNHGITTDNIGEGSNKYYSDTLVQNFLTTNNYVTSTDVATSLSTGAYFTSVSHDTVGRSLTFTKSDGATDSVDLTQYIDDTNLARLTSGTIDAATGIATFTRDDATTFTVDFSALLDDTNDYVTSASFNTSDGVLTLTRFGGTNVTVDLDGRYLESYTETDTLATVTARGASTSSDLTTGRLTLANNVSTGGFGSFNDYQILLYEDNLGASYSYGLGVESGTMMFHSNGAYRFYVNNAVKTTIDSSGNISTTGTLSASGYNNSNWDTAYGWGNHADAGYQLSGTAITTSNIGSQSVSYATNAGTLDSLDSTEFARGRAAWQTLSFDAIKQPGLYQYDDIATGGGTAPPDPSPYNFRTIEIGSGGRYSQVAFGYNTDSMYFRRHQDTAWSNWRTVIHDGNIGSYALTSLPSHTHDDRYLVKGGGWNATNMPGSRWGGFSANGGEITFQQDNPNVGQMSVLVDGNFYAGENNGFWSLYNNNDYNQKSGFYTDTSGRLYLQAASQVRISTDGYSDRMTINFDQIWTPVGNLYLQYSSAGWIYLNDGGGHTQSATSLRAPIFYDSNNTNYYLNPDADLSLKVYGEICNSGVYEGNMQPGALNIGGVNRNYNFTEGSWASDVRAGIMANCLDQWEFVIHDSGRSVESVFYYAHPNITMGRDIGWGSSPIVAANSFQAPTFYDSDNTGYYLNPNGTSQLFRMIINTNGTGVTRQVTIKEEGDAENSMGSYPGAWTSALNIQSNNGTHYLWLSPLTDNIPRIQTNYGQLDFYTGSNTGRALHLSGTSARTSILYDIDDTNFYVDPNSTSVLNNLTLSGDSNLEMRKEYGLDLRSLDSNTFYPVTFGVPASGVWLEIQNYLNTGPAGDWSTHPGGFSLNVMWRTNGNGWGTTAVRRQVFQYHESWTSKTICGGIGQLTQASREYIYLRGGGYYYLYSSRPISPTIETTTATYNGQSVAPRSGSSPANNVWESFTGSYHDYSDYVYTIALYDRNNTGYYLDPHATSNLNTVNASTVNATAVDATTLYGDDVYTTSGWFRNHTNNNGIYWSTTGWHLFPTNANDFTLRSGSSVESSIRFANSSNTTWGYIHNDANKTIGFLNNSRSWVSYTDTNGNHYAVGSSRAPIFYDSNNTSYYVDPNGGSYLLGLTVNASLDVYGTMTAYSNLYCGGDITSSGNVNSSYVGITKTSTYGTGMDLTYSGSQSTGMIIRNNTGNTDQVGIGFYYSSAPQGPRGWITIGASSVSYNTGSDYRLKENLTPITDGIERVKLLQPKRFNFIGDDKVVDGFLAHEAQEVVPEAVSGEKDAVDEDGNPKYQGIDQAKLVPLLTAALQEAISKIEDLEARIQTLEGQ
jgi:hypothetical protein